MTVKKEYEDKYKDQIAGLVDKTQNSEFEYDPLKDVNYQSLASQYGRLGDKARENTLNDAATLTGGRASSYAVTAGQQAQNDYNQALTDKIPALSEAAYNKFATERNNNLNMIGVLQGLESADYGKFVDDRGYDYQLGRDVIQDQQWNKSFNQADQQWKKEFELSKSSFEWNKTVDRWNQTHTEKRDKVTDKQWEKMFKQSGSTGSRSSSGSSRGGYGGNSSGGNNSSYNGMQKTGDGYNGSGGEKIFDDKKLPQFSSANQAKMQKIVVGIGTQLSKLVGGKATPANQRKIIERTIANSSLTQAQANYVMSKFGYFEY